MDVSDTATFGDLLRQYRTAAGLSQDMLAERAGLSTRAVSDLERGARRAPYRHTVAALAEALALSAAERAALEDAVRRTRGAATPASSPVTRPSDNLPAPLTSFVGRTREIDEVRRLLESTRLLTLLGAGGIGKTRLALMAAGQADGLPDGVWFVDLAPIGDTRLVPQAVAAAVGVREDPGRPLVETLGDALRSKRLLLILDNCEHVIAAVRTLAESLLRTCPGLHILATSRENLGLANETVWRVPSMAVPPQAGRGGSQTRPHAGLEASDAIRLFLERAQTALPAFVLTEANADAVVQVCRRLDGIPLAIELAAVRVKILTPEQIAARLDERFRLLTSASAFAPSRQQTLRAALDWSHDLLTEPERQLFRRLAVFAGGCDIEAVESVCAGDHVTPEAIFDLLSALADKSLVTVEYQGDTARYRLLETVRAYAAERLASAGERDAVRRRHARHLRSVTDAADAGLVGPEQDRWLRRLDSDLDNFRAALAYARERGWPADETQILYGLWRFWYLVGQVSEARGWLEDALSVRDHPPLIHAKLLSIAAVLAHSQGDYATARTALEESIPLWRQLDDDAGLAGALNTFGLVLMAQGEFSTAATALDEALVLFRAIGSQPMAARALNNLAAVAADLGDDTRAEQYHLESLAIKRTLADQHGIAASLHNLGEIARRRGEPARAVPFLEESVAILQGLGLRQPAALSMHSLALAVLALGDLDRADAQLAESLHTFRELEVRSGIALCVEGFAELSLARRDHERAARLLGAAEVLREQIGAPVAPVDLPAHEQTVAAVQAALPTGAFTAAWTAGRVLSLDQAMEVALATGEVSGDDSVSR